MCDWLGLHLDYEPERPELTLRTPAAPRSRVAVIVRHYQPPTADLWRLGGERRPEFSLKPELTRDLLQVPHVL
jgi:hypothetical protein